MDEKINEIEDNPNKDKKETEVQGADTVNYKEQLSQRKLLQLDEKLKLSEQDRKQRKKFGKWVLIVVSVWLGWVIIMVIIHTCLYGGLSEKVLCVLLGATAIVSLATTVLRGLFHNH